MRRMLSNKNVVDVVNNAIEQGEISVGGLPAIESGDAGKALIVNSGETGVEWGEVGLSPEDQEKLDNSLQLPESAPAAQQLVGINTSKEQNAIGIGEGLEITDAGALVAGTKILIVGFNNNNTAVAISDAIATNIQNYYYDIIIVKNYKKSGSQYFGFEFVKSYSSGVKYLATCNYLQKTVSQNLGTQIKNWWASLYTSGTEGNYTISISMNQDFIISQTEVDFVGMSGTVSASYQNLFKERYINDFNAYWKENAADSKVHLINWVEFTTGTTGYFVGLITDYNNGTLANYKIVIDKSDFTWTVSSI